MSVTVQCGALSKPYSLKQKATRMCYIHTLMHRYRYYQCVDLATNTNPSLDMVDIVPTNLGDILLILILPRTSNWTTTCLIHLFCSLSDNSINDLREYWTIHITQIFLVHKKETQLKNLQCDKIKERTKPAQRQLSIIPIIALNIRISRVYIICPSFGILWLGLSSKNNNARNMQSI